MRRRSRRARLEKYLGPRPPIVAAVADDATGRVVRVLRAPLDFEPAPAGLVADDLSPDCQIHAWEPQTTSLGFINPRSGQAAVQAVCGIDLDMVLGNKPGWLPGDESGHRRGRQGPGTPAGATGRVPLPGQAGAAGHVAGPAPQDRVSVLPLRVGVRFPRSSMRRPMCPPRRTLPR
jgi:hypothetical protein